MKQIKENVMAWYQSRNDRTKATLRTFGQGVVGSVLLLCLGLLSASTRWVGAPDAIDFWGEIASLGKIAVLGILNAATTLVTFFWNSQGRAPDYTSSDSIGETA